MKKSVLIPIVIVLLAVLGYFGYKKMNPPTVNLSGKEFDDSKSAKLRSGMPVYDNMVGKWSNDKKTIEIKDGKYIETVNGQTKVYDFNLYMHLPEACFPPNTGGDTFGFSIKNGSEVRCFGMRGLNPNISMAFVEVTSGVDVVESFTRN